MAGQAIVGRAFLLMTIDAKLHRVIDHTLGDSHLSQIAVTRCAIDIRANMRRMIETHVRFIEKTIDALPRHVLSALCICAERLNARITGIADIFVTSHAKVDARNSCTRSRLRTGVTFGA